MYSKGTISYFRRLIILESFLCINRSYLIDDRRTKLICNSISLTTACIVLGFLIFDLLISNADVSSTRRAFQLSLIIQLIYFAIGAKFKKTFNVIARLDEECGTDDDYVSKIQRKDLGISVLWILTTAMNIVASIVFQMDAFTALLFTLVTSVYDTEMRFLCLMIQGFNIRLSKLKDANPNEGSKVYRHVLIAANQFSEEFNLTLSIILAILLVKSIIYSFFLLLMEVKVMDVIFILYRQIETLVSLCWLCYAAADSKSISKRLAFTLAKRLMFDPKLDKKKFRNQYKVTRRLYLSVMREQPQYMSGAIQTLDLNAPLRLLDVSVNYLLIIVQIYAAYK